MNDDQALVDAYASIYNKKEEIKEEVQQLDEILPAIPLIAKGVMMASKIGKVAKIASKVGGVINKVNMAKDMVGGVVDKFRGKGQLNSQPAMAGYQPEGEMIEDVAITHLDGTTTEVIDVIKPEPLGNPDEKLADRLWDQVAANLTTLGEMSDTRYRVSPVEELEEKKKLDPVGQEDADIDNDGKVDDTDSYLKKRRAAIGKAMGKKMKKEEVETELDERACWDTHKKVGMKMKGGKLVNDCRPKNESFNVKSQVSFSKPEPVKEETISEETFEKHASSILKAHKSIKK
tara:strand:+ start:2875 stop:3741 length:867 start_codon:yes stop_codon:yes gene_type:complete